MAKEWLVDVVGDAAGTGTAPDLDEVRRALAVLADPEAGIQLQRGPHFDHQTFAGTDLDGMCAWVAEHGSSAHPGIYYSLNSIPPDLGHNLKSADVLKRRWLFIDVDRNKAHAPDDSATDAEHEDARALALSIRDYLDAQGWPAPVLVDSGNGFHLLYRIDLPCGPPRQCPAQKLLKAVLEQLAQRFDGELGTIGAECHDAKRIAKLPGTWARRGQQTTKRPWRLCRLLHVPAPLEVVSEALLHKLAEQPAPPVDQVEIETLHEFSVPVTSGNQTAYARSAFERECGRLALAPRGKLNDTAYAAAAACGNFVATGLLDEEEVFRGLLRALQSAGGNNPQKDEDVLRRGIEDGKSRPRSGPTANGTPTRPAPPSAEPTIYALPTLLGLNLPPPAWLVPGLLSEGLTILAGKPKLGKSWLALNLALTVAAGGKALGNLDVEPADVLYLSLEDRLRRIQDRARKVLAGLAFAPPGCLDIAVEWPRQDKGGLDHLKRWLDGRKRKAFLAVDVWAKFRPLSLGGRSAYDQDYEHISELKKVIDSRDASAVLVMHCKKAKAEDALDEVSGTLGLAGSTDGTLILTRARSELEAELFVTGRDVEEQSLALEFDPKGFTWKSVGKACERTESKLKAAAIAILKANTGQPVPTGEIAARMSLEAPKVHYLRCILARMADAGDIERVGNGRWKWPVSDPYEVFP
jgi:hypothetical protein